MIKAPAFLSGELAPHPLPISRFLPRLQVGVPATWLSASLPSGSWVIDPFGASPQLAVEAAQAGYRVLVAANNPIARFLIEMAATPPSQDAMQAALAELASTRRGEERLEPHLRGLYLTECQQCGAEISASAFLWEKDAEAPYGRIYTCRHCKQSGEFPATPKDEERARRHNAPGPHRARALERVVPANDPDRVHVEEALEAYLPRSVYALFTLINKLAGEPFSKEQHRLLAALTLSAADRTNTLWTVDGRRERPKQLTTPSRFKEHNLWLALEEAIPQWATDERATPLAIWPEQPPESGGICLYEGPLRELAGKLGRVKLAGSVTALPRPNQAFWTLSALWAGWLWGREAVGPFVTVLRRRRYDWAWHSKALGDAFEHLHAHLPAGAPLFALITESEAGFDSAALLAGSVSGFTLEGMAIRPRDEQTQLHWEKGAAEAGSESKNGTEIVQAAAHEVLKGRGEPAHFLYIQNAALAALAEKGLLESPGSSPTEQFNEMRDTLEDGLTFLGGFLRYGGSDNTLDIGQWWLREEEELAAPLRDRVERFVVKALIDAPGQNFRLIDQAACDAFPGLSTPSREIVMAVLESYGMQDDEGNWNLREAEDPAARRADIEEMQTSLRAMGERLGYSVRGEAPLVWQAGGEELHFTVKASAVLGEVLLNTDANEVRRYIVMPGGRAELWLHKKKQDPRLAQAAEGWGFLKFRLIRRLAQNENLSKETLVAQFEMDPLSEEGTQLPLF